MNLDSTDINTDIISLLITPTHNCLSKIGLPDTKKQVSCKLLNLIDWLGGNHSALLKVPPWRNFLNLTGACICNTWCPSNGRIISHVGQYSATSTTILIEPYRSRSKSRITKFIEGWSKFEDSTNTCPLGSVHSLSLFSLTQWGYDLVLKTLMYIFIWEIAWMGSKILAVIRKRKKMDVMEGWRVISFLEKSYITSWI